MMVRKEEDDAVKEGREGVLICECRDCVLSQRRICSTRSTQCRDRVDRVSR